MNTGNIYIRFAHAADAPAIHALVRELAIFEKAPEAHTATINDYIADMEAGFFQCLVAEVAGQVVGIALYHRAYSTWRGRQMYLEDFVVAEAYRSLGIGQLLFDKVVAEARKDKCLQLKWQVLDWNTDAIRFYKRQDADIESEWLTGKLLLL
jgi:GNAT superfamily N-acetyltransferase